MDLANGMDLTLRVFFKFYSTDLYLLPLFYLFSCFPVHSSPEIKRVSDVTQKVSFVFSRWRSLTHSFFLLSIPVVVVFIRQCKLRRHFLSLLLSCVLCASSAVWKLLSPVLLIPFLLPCSSWTSGWASLSYPFRFYPRVLCMRLCHLLFPSLSFFLPFPFPFLSVFIPVFCVCVCVSFPTLPFLFLSLCSMYVSMSPYLLFPFPFPFCSPFIRWHCEPPFPSPFPSRLHPACPSLPRQTGFPCWGSRLTVLWSRGGSGGERGRSRRRSSSHTLSVVR